jgi:hypothetical protein
MYWQPARFVSRQTATAEGLDQTLDKACREFGAIGRGYVEW